MLGWGQICSSQAAQRLVRRVQLTILTVEKLQWEIEINCSLNEMDEMDERSRAAVDVEDM